MKGVNLVYNRWITTAKLVLGSHPDTVGSPNCWAECGLLELWKNSDNLGIGGIVKIFSLLKRPVITLPSLTYEKESGHQCSPSFMHWTLISKNGYSQKFLYFTLTIWKLKSSTSSTQQMNWLSSFLERLEPFMFRKENTETGTNSNRPPFLS